MQTECINCQWYIPEEAIYCLHCYTPQGWCLDEHRRALSSQLANHPLIRTSPTRSVQEMNELRELLWHLVSKRLNDSTKANWLFLTVFDYLCGFGPLGSILRDPSVSLVIVKDFDQIFVSNSQGNLKVGTKYDSKNHLIRELHRLLRMNDLQLKANEKQCEFVRAFWNFKINLQPEPNDNFLVIAAFQSQ